MLRTRKAPTIQDVAREAGVSSATVSRALSVPERVSDATRRRVAAAVERTGYTLNQAARSLRKRTAKSILVALSDIGNPFFSTILDAIEREAASRGYGVLIANRIGEKPPMRQIGDYLMSNRADGLLLLDGSVDVSHLANAYADPLRMPVVVACEETPSSPLHAVVTDNRAAADTATAHLIELGHTRIAHVAAPRSNVFHKLRRNGYLDALKRAGIAARPEYVVEGDFSLESGATAARALMALDEPPTAVFCANDEMAIGFISALRKLGFECPDDVSVVGFDDIDVASHMRPPLTTMRQPREDIGRLAAAALLDILQGEMIPKKRLRAVLKSELVVRQSTRRLDF